ncbi:MAG: NAD(P)H-dependent oxidoreductase [Thermoflexales bacterium]|nr:NAD(P)H-dependent oxidoreductase [Thermoflexales bacterium]
MASAPIRILAFAGSLRKNSFNRGLIRAAQDTAPSDMAVEVFDLAGIPLFNQDLEREPPSSVVAFKAAIASADGVLIATPEYNFSVPGVLKNALDWASRPPREQPFVGKPVAIMSAGGRFGGLRAQLQLRQVGHGMGMLILSRPEVIVDKAVEKFDPNGNLTDTGVRDQVQGLVQALGAWAQRLA